MPRGARSGFVLLDALVAFALAAFAVTIIFAVLPGNATRSADRLNRLLASEFAYSVLEEYRVTHPAMALDGTTPDGWSWHITEQELPAASDGGTGELTALFEVSAIVWHEDRPAVRATLVTVLARRRE